jgi:ABC-2 type transport system permease protein
VHAISAERIKLLTLPSYPIAIGAALILLIATGTVRSLTVVWDVGDAAAVDSLTVGDLLNGVQYVQLLLAIVATMFITSEYSSGIVQRTLLAVPSRTPVLLAKAIVLSVTGCVVGALGSAAVLLVAPTVLASTDVTVTLPPELIAQVIVGCALYLAGVSVLALGVATLIRSAVGALAVVLTMLTVAPLAVSAIPIEWVANAAAYLPTTAGLLILQPQNPAAALNPWQGVAVLAGWALVATLAALVTLRRRDA